MELPKRIQNRLTEYHYGTAGAYFITVCAAKREKLFWETVGASIARPEDVKLSPIGKIVEQSIKEIPAHYPRVQVDIYAIMPDHIHLLLQILPDEDGRPMVAPTISKVVQQLKGIATKRAGRSLWQKGFYDHVVRGDEDYAEIWAYIEGNPLNWENRRGEHCSPVEDL